MFEKRKSIILIIYVLVVRIQLEFLVLSDNAGFSITVVLFQYDIKDII